MHPFLPQQNKKFQISGSKLRGPHGNWRHMNVCREEIDDRLYTTTFGRNWKISALTNTFAVFSLLCLSSAYSSSMTSENSMNSPRPTPPPQIGFRPYGKDKRPNHGVRNDLVCAFGEFLGTGMFLFLGLGGSNFAGNPIYFAFKSEQKF